MADQPSYLGAFLRHPKNQVAILATSVVGVFASIPMGWPGLALVGVLGLGVEILAALLVPSLPSFRAAVDKTQRAQARAQRRLQLLGELSQRGDSRALSTYQHMAERVQALHQAAHAQQTTLKLVDVEKLEDLTVDYLALSAVLLSLQQRRDSLTQEQLAKRIASVQAQLQTAGLAEDETRQLRDTLDEYEQAMDRARRLAVRRSAMEATLVAMPDKMEEVYQLVMSAPHSADMGTQLEDSLNRLRWAEEVAAEFDSPPRYVSPTAPVPNKAGAASALKA